MYALACLLARVPSARPADSARLPSAWAGWGYIGFRGLGVWGLGFRGSGFRGLGVRV